MNCFKCHIPFNECSGMLPIEPKGTPNRKWICTDCATTEEKSTVPSDIRELSNVIAGKEVF